MWFDKTLVLADGTTPAVSAICAMSNTNANVQRSCCPRGAAAPAGVRCVNMTIVP
jgi:hypothetical protein